MRGIYLKMTLKVTAAVAVKCCRIHLTSHRDGKTKIIEFTATVAVCGDLKNLRGEGPTKKSVPLKCLRYFAQM